MAVGKPQRAAYSDATNALATLGRDFNYWSQKLTDSSWQMCLAVIAGNWAYYGSIDAIMKSRWALISLALIFASLAAALLFSFVMSEAHRNAYYAAEDDWGAWQGRFERYQKGIEKRDPFPANRLIDRLGVFTRALKTTLPLIAGTILIIGALRSGLPASKVVASPNTTTNFYSFGSDVVQKAEKK